MRDESRYFIAAILTAQQHGQYVIGTADQDRLAIEPMAIGDLPRFSGNIF